MLPYTSLWTEAKLAFLVENYPKHGKLFCMDHLGMSESQIRSKASNMGLVARGISSAWQEKQKTHAKKLVGKKRPEQALVINKLRAEGKLKHTPERRAKQSESMKRRLEIDGHPRGMSGKKHSLETKAKYSADRILLWANKTEEERDLHAMRMSLRKSPLANRKAASWKCGWREIGNQRKYFRSRWEANYARYLQFLKEKELILSWEHEAQTFWFDGIKRGVMSYLPDFRVTEISGAIAFHEVKGWMDARSKTTINRMRIYHPDIKLIVVEKKAYTEIKNKIGRLIDGWEV